MTTQIANQNLETAPQVDSSQGDRFWVAIVVPKVGLLGEDRMMRIAICGDWAPEHFATTVEPFDTPAIINLEGPILDEVTLASLNRSPKAGPNLSSRELPDFQNKVFFSLANNHIMDFGDGGLLSTIAAIGGSSGSTFFGAGRDVFEAQRPLMITENGLSVAFLSRSERQFGEASATRPGVAGIEPGIKELIRKLKKRVDHVVLLLHGGSEMAPLPSPTRRDLWRSYIDAGASAVIGNHVHVPSAWERYRHGIVFYGLGNFCVNPQKWSWHPEGLWSIVPVFRFDEGQVSVEIGTTCIGRIGNTVGVRWASDSEYARHSAHLAELNDFVKDGRMLESVWQETSMLLLDKYYASWLGIRRAVRAQEKVRRLVSAARSVVRSRNWKADAVRRKSLLLFHLFACESHSDAITTALAISGGEIPDLRSEVSAKLVQRFVHLD